MNHYEELGVEPDATPAEISKAHRVLTRLLHPDAQADDAVRAAAERQMRRINAIVEVLLDPARRRRYDQTLQAPPGAPAPVANARERVYVQARERRSFQRRLGVVIAVALAAAFAWYATHDLIAARGWNPLEW